MDKKKEEVAADPRFDLIGDMVLLSYRAKPDRWTKMIASEDNIKILQRFLDDPNENEIILTLVGGQFYVYKNYEPNIKQKYTIFSRKQKEKVTVENFRDVLRYGEMSGNPIEDLAILMNGIFNPFLNHPGNQVGWPRTVKVDMANHLKDFTNQLEEIRGAIANQTVLPMPAGVVHVYQSLSSLVGSNGEENDLDFKEEIENAVVRWSHICHEITKQNSKLAFTDGAHPTPMEEVNFWKSRYKNLQYIYDQLVDPRVKKMAEYLEASKSTYLKMFKSTFQNVVASLVEAKDITLYLKPLIPHIKRFEENDFLELKNHIKPLIHVVALIWSHSKYYANCEKIITLFKEISNLLIECAVKDLDPSSIFLGEAEEICVKVTKTIEMLNIFLDTFEYVRQNLKDFYDKNEKVTPLEWTFHRRRAFQRLLELLDRLHLIKKILEANINYSKLERVEIGGLRGKYLTMKCEEIFADFGRVYSVFQNITYNALDIEDNQIHGDCKLFEEKCDDIDNRLASVFEQAFDDCTNLDASFKLINIIGNLMERPSVRSEVTKKLPELIEKMNDEVDSIKKSYDDCEKNGVQLHNYCPPIFGRVFWYKKLRERIDSHEEHLRLIEHEIIQSEEAVYMLAKYAQMREILDQRTSEVLTEWAERIREEIQESMDKTQLAKDAQGDIFVNLDPRLEAILREMRYLKQLNIEDLPEEAQAVFVQVEAFYNSYIRLKRIQEYYNFLKNQTLLVEHEMITAEMTKLDNILEPIMTHITWNENDPENVEVMYEIVKYLYDRVAEAQENVANLMKKIETWSTVPLFERKDCKKENLLYTDDRAERIQKRYDQINACALELKNVLYHNYHLYFDLPYTPPPTPPAEATQTPDKDQKREKAATLGGSPSSSSSDEPEDEVDMLDDQTRVVTVESASHAETSGERFNKRREYIQTSSQKLKKFQRTTSEEDKSMEEFTKPPEATISMKWNGYLTHLDKQLKKKLQEAVLKSQKYFIKEMGGAKPITPFLEISMHLKEPDIVYEPSIDTNDKPNILSNMEDLLQDIYNMGLYMERIDPDSQEENHFNDLIDMMEGIQNYEAITFKILTAMGAAADFVDNFVEYIPIWASDRQEYLREFLKYSRPLTPEERHNLIHKIIPPIKDSPPTLELFKERIDYYDQLYEQVKSLPQEHLVDGGWFRIVVRPLRQAIMNTICKWGNLFKQHLYNHVVESLNTLDNFIAESTGVMLTPLESDDIEGLLRVMKFLFRVKEMMVETDAMFEPLKNIMDLLSSYKVEFPEEIYIQLQEIPDRWNHCKKIAATTKQNVSSLQTVQINTIKKRIRLFDVRISLYRQQFRRDSIFNFDCKNVYQKIDRKHSEIVHFEEGEKELIDDGNIFDITIEEFKPIKHCRKELRQVKQLWDYISMMNSCIDEWRSTPWKKIDIENMEISCKRFVKDLRAMDKETKSWNVYVEGEKTIKNLLTSLRAVTELQNPAIRERHWKQLMQATKVPFVMSEDTTLNNLLELNLHEFEDEVKTIVDKSVKEMGMEKILKELEATWTVMSFSTETHPSTGVHLLHISEELIECLEDNQSSLQSMMSSKFIDYFLDEVTKWQNLLSTADQVIQLFVEVQHKWMYLESIFIGSDDIRIQLPEDSKRFEQIDKEFREILTNLSRNLNVIAVTNQPGLYEKLERLSERLTLCEKALNDYLETKRLAFPRFYFVSSADLLDILSNGNQPELIQRHLTKLFDSLARLVSSSPIRRWLIL
ncbi:hypothetical protein WA026_017537 [Henosepilachna vigintioctopunctata]|uniref:Uncharacterized protein n=1 Tax=Henosepilachna vigintioctopunctata TaxID=420089 RepID=A0AAW1UVV3_9CUCU